MLNIEGILFHLDMACRQAAESGVDALGPNVGRNLAVAKAMHHVPILSRRDGDGDGRDPARPNLIFEYQLSTDGERWQIGNLPMKPLAARAVAETRIRNRISRTHEFIFAAFRHPKQGGSSLDITAIFRVAPDAVEDEFSRQLKQAKKSTGRLNFTITAAQLRRLVRNNRAVVEAVKTSEENKASEEKPI